MTAIIDWSNLTSFAQIPALANTASGGWFWNVMVFLIYVVLLILFVGTWGFEMALIVPAFICALISIILLYAGLVSIITPAIFVSIMLVMIMYTVWSGSKQ